MNSRRLVEVFMSLTECANENALVEPFVRLDSQGVRRFKSEMRSLLRLFPIFVFATSLKANELRLANLFADGAVLQREMPIPVWGTASPGEQIRVTFGKQTRQATTAGDGRWQVTLSALKASTEPRTLTVASEIREIVIQDVVVGEVWLCSGQSNMAMRVDLAQDAEREKTASDLPLIRVHTVAHTPAREDRAQTAQVTG